VNKSANYEGFPNELKLMFINTEVLRKALFVAKIIQKLELDKPYNL
jgi:hypothetical protein